MFLLKKIIGFLLMPMSILLVLFFFGIITLWSTKRQRAAKIILTLTCLLLVFLSYGFVSYWPLEKLESLYPPLDVKMTGLNKINWVVVLAGDDQETAVRLAEGIRIYRSLPGARLLVSGGKVNPTAPAPASEEMARMAVELGVNPADIVQESISRDTKDEAKIIKSMLGEKQFILVTSAYHMPRSMALFMAQGMRPNPAPTGFLIKEANHLSPVRFFPSAESIHDAELVVHEILGILSARIMGQL
ncbi:MAG: ElyC/SanA/YdcF family protein [Desulfomonilia bacterium]|jgi:uncharacterized SAM-binding protein YcdF (DUF218 family)